MDLALLLQNLCLPNAHAEKVYRFEVVKHLTANIWLGSAGTCRHLIFDVQAEKRAGLLFQNIYFLARLTDAVHGTLCRRRKGRTYTWRRS